MNAWYNKYGENMVYMMYGEEEFLIKQEIKKIIKKENIDEYSKVEYDLENTNIKDIIDDISTVSLFSSKKIVIVWNSYIFTGTTSKSKIEQDIKSLEKYLKNPDQENILIFVTNSEKLDSRKKIVNLLKQNGTILEFNKCNQIIDYVIEMCKPYKISRVDASLLVTRVGSDLSILYQEIEKMKTYLDKTLEITKEDILLITHKTIDVDIFHLVDNIILKQKKQALESYYEMIKLGEEPIKIIVILANQFRLLYQVKRLKMKGYSIFDMMSMLGQKKYPIEKSLERVSKFSEDTLLKYLYELAELDINIKSGRIDKNIGLELFILGV